MSPLSRRIIFSLALAACLEPAVLGYAPSIPGRTIAAASISSSRRRGHPLSVSTSARSESDTDMEFAAFAESLEDPVPDVSNDNNSADDQTWQACVDELLDPMTPLARRQELLAKLVNANQDIQESVLTAMRERKVCIGRTSLLYCLQFLPLPSIF